MKIIGLPDVTVCDRRIWKLSISQDETQRKGEVLAMAGQRAVAVAMCDEEGNEICRILERDQALALIYMLTQAVNYIGASAEQTPEAPIRPEATDAAA